MRRRWIHGPGMYGGVPAVAALSTVLGCAPPPTPAAPRAPAAIRVNQLGYLPDHPKVAVLCATSSTRVREFRVVQVPDDSLGATAADSAIASAPTVLGPLPASAAGAFGPCAVTYRLDFSALRNEGIYRLTAGGLVSPALRISAHAYAGAADALLFYLRQQRSLFNPLFRDSVHQHTDAILVDDAYQGGSFIPVAGGWADAADYLQYVTTSANATFLLLQAYRDHPHAFGDAFQANGLPGANGVPDVLDEARWGLEWLIRMHPREDLLLNQIGDDRDHAFLDLPTTDSSDYGWGRGGYRPVYPCTGRPQGLFTFKNRSTGFASTAGKYTSAMALGAQLLADRDPAFAALLGREASAIYRLGLAHPGVCQTAPARAPYFYEEENWADDMELGAAELYALTGATPYLRRAIDFAAREPVSPWMGRDTARHYEFYPWHNNGHYEIWRRGDASQRALMALDYQRGLEAVVNRAQNGFRVGIPFIWCSNDLMASFATQALLYREMSGDTTFLTYENAALDWLFGTNPWGVSMVIGLPATGRTPRDPHSVVARQLGVATQHGGLVDGPVYRSIYKNLMYIQLLDGDEFAPWNTGFIVYHDDFGDYSTNEPIMDGTANLAYLLSALAGGD